MNSNFPNNDKKPRRNRRRRNNGVRTNFSRIGGLENPFPTRKIIKVVTTTDGSAQAAAASFCVLEARLADPTNAGFSGGTGGLTVATAGIADMAAYALARVRSATVEVSGASLETGALVSANLIFSDVQPSTVVTTYALAKAAAISYYHTPLRKIAVSTGNSAFRFSPVTVTAQKVIGDVMPTTDRDFVTVVNPAHTAPSQEWWCALIVTSVGAATNLTNGLDVNLTVTQMVEAFSRLVGT